MKSSEYYYTIDRPASEEFKDRGSRFIAFAYPVETAEAFKKFLQQLKKEHAKAVHHCFAYRIGVTGDNFRVSDDGEPSGTAGKQILGQLDSRKLSNASIIVVRYFGGTLLGVPGLINAYKTAAALVLQTVPIIQRQIEIIYSIHFDYTQVNDIMQVLKQANCTIIQQDLQLFSIIKTGIPGNRHDEVLHRLNDLRNVTVERIL
ncbi:MAG: YigZ family protein [Ferruginibacter sp.]